MHWGEQVRLSCFFGLLLRISCREKRLKEEVEGCPGLADRWKRNKSPKRRKLAPRPRPGKGSRSQGRQDYGRQQAKLCSSKARISWSHWQNPRKTTYKAPSSFTSWQLCKKGLARVTKELENFTAL